MRTGGGDGTKRGGAPGGGAIVTPDRLTLVAPLRPYCCSSASCTWLLLADMAAARARAAEAEGALTAKEICNERLPTDASAFTVKSEEEECRRRPVAPAAVSEEEEEEEDEEEEEEELLLLELLEEFAAAAGAGWPTKVSAMESEAMPPSLAARAARRAADSSSPQEAPE